MANPIFILLIGIIVVVGGIIGFKLHPFLALLLAAQHGHLATVKYLVNEIGASVKDANTEGFTPLLMAAFTGIDYNRVQLD